MNFQTSPRKKQSSYQPINQRIALGAILIAIAWQQAAASPIVEPIDHLSNLPASQ